MNSGRRSSRQALRGADIIHRGFDDYHTRFRAITRRTKQRFERRDWDGIHRDTVSRMDVHPQAVRDTFDALERQLGDRIADKELWAAMKEAYSYSVLGSHDFELAQTFFNSLSRRVLPHVGVDPAIDYVTTDFPLPFRGWEMASARMYAVRSVDAVVLRKVLEDAGFRVPFRDLEGDVELAAAQLRRRVVEDFGGPEIEALDVLRPVFIRNKGAYVIGRVRRGKSVIPMLIALLNGDDGIRVDAVLDSEDQASSVFSFARWYFHADLESPREVIGFLHSVLPRKRLAELYISLGYNKHGKTEFYSDLMCHIADAEEPFVVAPGRPGLVMSVFTLPSYEFVYKVIRDRFPPVKHTTREQVMEKYREVLAHDKVGRLVDFQEFEDLKFPRALFSDELLAELLSSCSRTVSAEGSDVIVRHAYVGRRVTPLDLFVRRAAREAVEAAVIDWGYNLKDLGAANIFPGDMLPKNFGVTRHGRVVFYDYDEIRPLSSCNFRRFPPPRDDLDDMAAEPWFSVAENDVFPEEMRRFLGFESSLEEVFVRHHRDLFEAEFWRRLQERNREGEPIDFFPYTRAQRLRPEKPEPVPA